MAYAAHLGEYRGISDRDSIGGHALLPPEMEWPVCPRSGLSMVLFLQFDVRREFGLSVAEGSHFAIFMSPAVNEIPSFDFVESGEPLPERFWERYESHFRAFLFPPDQVLTPRAEDPYLEPRRLVFQPVSNTGNGLIVGGDPVWLQDPEVHPGTQLLLSIPENYGFRRKSSAPPQPDSFSDSDYCLFLGNATYIFAVPAQPDPRAVWITVQN